MPRANRYFLPGYIWHITHRCHERQFLLKFVQDRRAWRYWAYQARKRYGLCLLNFVVTSNHVHLLVKDMGKGEIARSMQLISGRVAQQYNRRKSRNGAFWEDRYHATAVQADSHLARCMVYIDLMGELRIRHPGRLIEQSGEGLTLRERFAAYHVQIPNENDTLRRNSVRLAVK